MSMNKLLQALSLEKLDKDLFRSILLWTPREARGTFGGQLVAHCVEAACQTVDGSFACHSLHSNFLSGGNSQKPIYYRVRRLRDGKTFAVRSVTAQQDGAAIFIANVSFHIPEKAGIQHSPIMPKVPSPHSAYPEAEFMESLLQDDSSPQFQQNLRRKMNRDTAPVSIRYLHRGTPDKPFRSKRPTCAWMKADLTEQDLSRFPNNRVHLLMACWLSDFHLALAGLVHHGFPNMNTSMLVSLDHTIYFHKTDFRADQWFLYEVFSHWANNNRALNSGRIYTRDGELAFSVYQESLVRMSKDYVSVSKL